LLRPTRIRSRRDRGPGCQPASSPSCGLHVELSSRSRRKCTTARSPRVSVEDSASTRPGRRFGSSPCRRGSHQRSRGARAKGARAGLARARGRTQRPRIRDPGVDHTGHEQRGRCATDLSEPQHREVLHPYDLPQARRRQPHAGGLVGCGPRVQTRPSPHRTLARRTLSFSTGTPGTLRYAIARTLPPNRLHRERLAVTNLADLPDEPVPEWRAPTLATLTDKRFSDPRWIFERKFDGMRCLAFRDGRRVRLLSRNRKSLNGTYPELVDALAAQQNSRFVVDGEVVAFEGRRTSFARLQGRLGITDPNAARASEIRVFYYLFDLLHVDGKSTIDVPLTQRKRLLRNTIEFTDPLRNTPIVSETEWLPTGPRADAATKE